MKWVAPGGYLHLGLYHLYGRRPFLAHFAKFQADGASHSDLYDEFRKLNPDSTDETHLLSWFRDQVLHSHETQHTYDEVQSLLVDQGFVIEATSINNSFVCLRRQKRSSAAAATIRPSCTKAAALSWKKKLSPNIFAIS